MKRWIFRALVLLLTLFVFTILRAPAMHAIAYLSPHISPVIVSQPEGTVWKGEAAALVHPQITLNNVQWDYRALASLFSGPGIDLQGQTATGQFDTVARIAWSQLFTPGSVTLNNTNALVPIADLPLPPIARSIPLSGDIIIKLDELIVDAQWPVAASGRVALAALQFQDKSTWDLGTLVADIETVESGIKANLSSDSETISLQGVAQLNHDGSYQVTADLNLNSQLPIVLRTMLSAAGAKQADGSTRISYQGKIKRPKLNTP